MFKKGLKAGKGVSLADRSRILRQMRKCSDISDVLPVVRRYVDIPDFKSVVDQYEFLVGFLVGLTYFTRGDIFKEMRSIVKLLNLEGLNLSEYYIFFSEYVDRRYGKVRYKIDLIPRPGSLAKKTSRTPKVKDPYEAREMVSILREYLELLEVVDRRRTAFLSKIS